jgi:hypothetical protein
MKRGPGRPKKVLPKEMLELKFTQEEMLNFKKVLFRHGLTAHQFMGYVIQQISVNDQRLVEILQEATEYKKQRILEGKEEHVDAETLYRMIEEENKKLQK